jgi:hypothetical protein
MSRARNLSNILGSDGSFGSTDVTTALGYTPVNKAGDTMSGRLIAKDDVNADKSYPLAIQNQSQQQWWLRAETTSNRFAVHLNGFGNVLTADNSGRVTMPNQPAFQTNGAGYSLIANEIWAIRPSAMFNVGNHYNVSNGRFTAPVAGKYNFHFLHTTASTTPSPTLYFRINGSGVYGRTLNYYTQYSSSTSVVVLNLSVGDYVEAIIEAWNSAAVSTWEASWGGYLIG